MRDIAKAVDLAFKVLVILLLALITYQEYNKAPPIAYAGPPDVQDVRIVNTDKERIPVDAQLPKIDLGYYNAVPVRVVNDVASPLIVEPIR
jgi:hypothetical protein